jgi:hypothetical protein
MTKNEHIFGGSLGCKLLFLSVFNESEIQTTKKKRAIEIIFFLFSLKD